jgi:predicted outer membrane repeat protein
MGGGVMSCRNRLHLAAILLILIPTLAYGTTLHVPSEYPTIQAGVDAAEPGDTVLVAAGNYSGPGNRYIEFFGKDISVISAAGPEVTVIDGDWAWRAFTLRGGESQAARVEGFTMTHCGGQFGGAISCDPSSPTVSRCIFIENGATLWGGAIYSNSNPTFIGCVISNNSAPSGGGVYGSATLEDCVISENTTTGHGGGLCGDFTLRNCLILGNMGGDHGGGIYTWGAYMEGCVVAGNRAERGGGITIVNLAGASIQSSTITGNFADIVGGGIHLTEPYMVSIERSIIRGNCAVSMGSDMYGWAFQPIPVVCSAVDTLGIAHPDAFEFIGEQVYSDPLFCDPESCEDAPTVGGDYSLMSGSPCLPENSPCGELIGALGLGCPSSSSPEDMVSLPQPVILSQPKPNPSTGLVVFRVHVGVYDVRGRLVERLADRVLNSGRHSIRWEAPRRGLDLGSGVYYIRVRSGRDDVTRKVIVIH